MSQTAGVQPAELTLTVLSGPDKGAVYKLVSQSVKIGRSADNDIILQDARCSRNHAVIEFTTEGIFLINRSPSNAIDVDGIKSEKCLLKTGSHIMMGNTVLKFEIRSPGQRIGELQSAGLVPQMPSAIPSLAIPQSATTSTLQNVNQTVLQSDYMGPVQRSASKGQNKTPLYIGVGVIGLVLIIALGDQAAKLQVTEELRTETALEEELKATQERLSTLTKEQEKRGVDTPEYKEVQSLITQGMRDYREGQYGRALLALDSALALKPDSETARKYRDLAKRRFDELIQVTMQEGRRYREQGKYSQAANAYRQAMIYISDPKNKQFQEAQELNKESELLMKGAY